MNQTNPPAQKKTGPWAYFLIAALALAGAYLLASYYGNMNANNQPAGNQGQTEINIYYNHISTLNTDCSAVMPVQRTVPALAKPNPNTDQAKGMLVGQALTHLFAGPTEQEQETGFTSFFSEKTSGILKNVSVRNSTAYVNLTDIRQIIPNASSSCGSASFLAQINQTAGQFGSVNRVILAINGSPRDLYEWLQLGCSQENNNCDPEPFK